MTSIVPVSRLLRVRWLMAEGNLITSLVGVSSLKSLELLFVAMNDISAVLDLSELKVPFLYSWQYFNFDFCFPISYLFQELPQLQILDLSLNPVWSTRDHLRQWLIYKCPSLIVSWHGLLS